MKSILVEVKRDDNVFQLENWPTATPNLLGTAEVETAVADNVTQLISSASTGPICKDGVCQLGEWKPKRNVA